MSLAPARLVFMPDRSPPRFARHARKSLLIAPAVRLPPLARSRAHIPHAFPTISTHEAN